MKQFYFPLFIFLLAFGLRAQTTHTVFTKLDNGSANSLRSKILFAQSGDIIRFSPNLLSGNDDTIHLTQGALLIDKTLTIKGLYNGSDSLVISGERNKRVFNTNGIAASDVVILDSLVIAKGYASNGFGGGIYHRNGKLIIRNSKVASNEANGITISHGGGIYADASQLEIWDSKISNNLATPSGMGLNQAHGGGIYADSTLVLIYNSTINHNSVANYYRGNAYGGGVFSRSEVRMYNSNLVNNNCILSESVIATASYWTGGGGIFGLEDITMSKCLVDGNKVITLAPDDCYAHGGGIYSGRLVNLDSTHVQNNSTYTKSGSGGEAESMGGGIYAKSLNMLNSFVLKNQNISNSTIISRAKGGGIALQRNGNSMVRGSIISDNKTIDSSNGYAHGGGVYIDRNSSFTLDQSVLSKNEVKSGESIWVFSNPAAAGGGLYSDYNTTILVKRSTVSENIVSAIHFDAPAKGGGLYCENQLTVENSTINSNHLFSNTEAYGGGIYMPVNQSKRLYITSSTVAFKVLLLLKIQQ